MTCDIHRNRKATIKIDAAGTEHRMCRECRREVARVLTATTDDTKRNGR